MFLPILALLSSPPALAQEAPDEAVTAAVSAEASTLEVEVEVGDAPAARPQRKAPRRPTDMDAAERNDLPLWLAIVALLGLLLVSRRQPYRKAAIQRRTRANRPTPITDEELGRFVFHAVVSADLDEYRALFLTGAEAGQVLGSGQAERYLATRTVQRLEDALVDLAVRIPESNHFAGVERAGDRLSLRIVDEQGAERSVLVGTVADIGTAHRLVSPASQIQDRSGAITTA